MGSPNPKPNTIQVTRLYMNRLNGRMLKVAASRGKKRHILLIGDRHGCLELWQPLAEDLSKYGHVAMPDLPGFGGMKSFYRIGQQPSLDLYADYLASFVKLTYKRKSVTVAAVGYGFVVVTRMLQRYPDLARKVELVVAFDGIAHWRDGGLNGWHRRWQQLATRVLARRWPAIFVANTLLHPWLIQWWYKRQSKQQFGPRLDRRTVEELAKLQTRLWHRNDLRTRFWSKANLLSLDNCQQPVTVPVWQVSLTDSTKDNFALEQHLNVIYHEVKMLQAKLSGPSLLVASINGDMAALLPRQVRYRLGRPPSAIAKR